MAVLGNVLGTEVFSTIFLLEIVFKAPRSFNRHARTQGFKHEPVDSCYRNRSSKVYMNGFRGHFCTGTPWMNCRCDMLDNHTIGLVKSAVTNAAQPVWMMDCTCDQCDECRASTATGRIWKQREFLDFVRHVSASGSSSMPSLAKPGFDSFIILVDFVQAGISRYPESGIEALSRRCGWS